MGAKMAELLVPYHFGKAEFSEKKSVFIGRVWYCASEEEALNKISEVRSEFRDAKHNVYAYSFPENNITRFYDDSEPHGTAGKPILSVFEHEGISNYLCIVTRYFGGVLLGTGGLTRAYAKAAKLSLDAAQIGVVKHVNIFDFTCSYFLYDIIKAEIDTNGGQIVTVNFGSEIRINLLIPAQATEYFIGRITELSAGLIKPEIIGTQPIIIKKDT